MRMTTSCSIWLLAAYLTIVIAGPLPHLRHPSPHLHYLNISSTLTTTSPYGLSSFLNPASTVPSTRTTQDVEADTAVVVEPIDRTVFTRTEAAITFVNPKGDPLVTQPEETVLSTSYITKISSTERPTFKVSPRASTLTAMETTTSTQDLGISVDPSARSITKPSEHLSGNTTTSVTAPGGPMFTYEPDDITTAGDTSRPTITITISSFTTVSGGLDGTISQTAQSSVPVNTSAALTSELPQSTMGPTSQLKNQSTALTGQENSSSVKRTVFVTSTEYTTLYSRSSTPSQVVSQPSSQSPSSAITSESGLPTLTDLSTLSTTTAATTKTTTSSIPAALPTSSLSPPPIIVITPSVGESSGQAAPSTTESPQSSETTPVSSQAADQPSSGNGGFIYPSQRPTASSNTLSTSAEAPSSVSVDPSSTSPESTGATLSSAGANMPSVSTLLPTPPSASSKDPSPAPSTTSSGPLVVVPIDTSQIFTVTFTTTMTEKETITVTATVRA